MQFSLQHSHFEVPYVSAIFVSGCRWLVAHVLF